MSLSEFSKKATIEVIIISYNCKEHTINCIESIKSTTSDLPLLITVVDNNSSDDTIELLKKYYPEVNLIENSENLGYGAAINIGAIQSNAEFLLLANADLIFCDSTITKLISELQNDTSIGACGPQQLYPNGKWQYSYGYFPGLYAGFMYMTFLELFNTFLKKLFFRLNLFNNLYRRVQYIDGALIAVRRKDFLNIGGFDTDYFFYSEEADFCYKLYKQGLKRILVPESNLIHLRGGASAYNKADKKFIHLLNKGKVIFCLKHRNAFATKFFLISQIIHNFVIYCLLTLLSWFQFKNWNDRIKEKKEFMKLTYKDCITWLRNLKKTKFDLEKVKKL